MFILALAILDLSTDNDSSNNEQLFSNHHEQPWIHFPTN